MAARVTQTPKNGYPASLKQMLPTIPCQGQYNLACRFPELRLDMWPYFKSLLVFILLLVLLPLLAVLLLKLLILAGAWTIESLTEPLYAITAGVVFLVVLGIAIWSLVESESRASVRPTVYCNACGKRNWADATNCHSCRAQILAPPAN